MSFQQFRPAGFSLMPTIVKNLLIVNGLFFLAKMLLGSNYGIDLDHLLGLHHFDADDFAPYQFLTYMFMHGDIGHILFNMFALWMFGSSIENAWGPKRFLIYYLLTGIGAGAIYLAYVSYDIAALQSMIDRFAISPTPEAFESFVSKYVPMELLRARYPEIAEEITTLIYNLYDNPDNAQYTANANQVMLDFLYLRTNTPNVGASGSVYGILLAFGMMFPNVRLFLLFIPIPIKAKYFVIGYGVMELWLGLQNSPSDNVAHFAHLGGMLVGFILIKIWQKRSNRFI